MSEEVVMVPHEGEEQYELASLEDVESCREILSSPPPGSSYRRKIKDTLKIFRSRNEMFRLASQYKVLALTSSLAVIGLVITIRMVRWKVPLQIIFCC